jgi:hypothetical protein
MNEKSASPERLMPSFHRTFSVIRPEIASVLAVYANSENNITRKMVEEGTTLGSVKIEAMPRYARGCGFVNVNANQITALGSCVFENDPNLTRPATLWLMHYHLSAPHGPGPLYWHYAIKTYLRSGAEIEVGRLGENIGAFLNTTENQKIKPDTAQGAVSVLLGSYSKDDGLAKIGLLERVGRGYRVLEPEPAPLQAIGYALAHYWESVWGSADTINLNDLFTPGGFADLMYLSEIDLKDALRGLQRQQQLELWRVAPPHQVVKRWASKEDFLAHLYD